MIQKELENIKDNWNSHRMEVDLLVDRTYFTLLGKVPVSISLSLTMTTWRLVKEECCADERNTFWVCSNELFKLVAVVMEENGLFEANFPEEALLLFQELYQLIFQI